MTRSEIGIRWTSGRLVGAGALAASLIVGAMVAQSNGLAWAAGGMAGSNDGALALASPDAATGSPSDGPVTLDQLTESPEPTADASSLPGGSPSSVPATAATTRVVLSQLGIDLPVIAQVAGYPACNVAMYLLNLKQPGQGGVTYLYAHARTGMFLPLLTRSKINNGAAMIGMAVEVYTDDSLKHTYQISEVRRHITSLRAAFAWQGESVWLQTSEGPNATYPKLQLVSGWVATEPASFEAAHPDAHPVRC